MGLDEEVLCIRESLIQSLGAFEGFQTRVDAYLPEILKATNQSFLSRRLCETDPSFKQLIPYVLVYYEEGGETYLFQYVRGSGQGEKRLHALRSLGIGGHISTEDTSGTDLYQTGMDRELDEEVIFDNKPNAPIVGLIYDPSNEVGKVHLGVVHLMKLDGPTMRAREEDLLESGFLSLAQVRNEIDRLETWSRLCVEAIFPSKEG